MSHYFSLTVLQSGYSPLYVASEYGHTDIVDILVKAGADVHQACTTVCDAISDVIRETFTTALQSHTDMACGFVNVVHRYKLPIAIANLQPSGPENAMASM